MVLGGGLMAGAMGGAVASIIINAETQNAQEALKAVIRQMSGLEKGALVLGGVMSAVGTKVTRTTYEWGLQAVALNRMRWGYDLLSKRIGLFGDEMIDTMRKAAGGTVSEMEMIRVANQAMASEVVTNTDQMLELYQIARVRARMFGIASSEAFDMIQQSIGTLIPRQMRQIGIVMNLNELYNRFSEETGRSAATLTIAEKRQLIYNETLRQGAVSTEELALVNQSADTSLRNMNARLTDITHVVGKGAEPVMHEFSKRMTQLLEAILADSDALEQLGSALMISGPIMAVGGAALVAAVSLKTMAAAAALLNISLIPIGAALGLLVAIPFAVWMAVGVKRSLDMNKALAQTLDRIEALDQARKAGTVTDAQVHQAMVAEQDAVQAINEEIVDLKVNHSNLAGVLSTEARQREQYLQGLKAEVIEMQARDRAVQAAITRGRGLNERYAEQINQMNNLSDANADLRKNMAAAAVQGLIAVDVARDYYQGVTEAADAQELLNKAIEEANMKTIIDQGEEYTGVLDRLMQGEITVAEAAGELGGRVNEMGLIVVASAEDAEEAIGRFGEAFNEAKEGAFEALSMFVDVSRVFARGTEDAISQAILMKRGLDEVSGAQDTLNDMLEEYVASGVDPAIRGILEWRDASVSAYQAQIESLKAGTSGVVTQEAAVKALREQLEDIRQGRVLFEDSPEGREAKQQAVRDLQAQVDAIEDGTEGYRTQGDVVKDLEGRIAAVEAGAMGRIQEYLRSEEAPQLIRGWATAFDDVGESANAVWESFFRNAALAEQLGPGRVPGAEDVGLLQSIFGREPNVDEIVTAVKSGFLDALQREDVPYLLSEAVALGDIPERWKEKGLESAEAFASSMDAAYWQELAEATAEPATQIGDNFEVAFERAITKVEELEAAVLGLPSEKMINVVIREPGVPGIPPSLPVFPAQHGFNGLVNKPTMFLAGEGGRPEHVSIGSGGGGGPISLTVVFQSEISLATKQEMEQAALKLLDVLEDERQRRGL